jgi:heptaprenyl diphosphate synthase
MRSTPPTPSPVRKLTALAVLSAIGIALYVLESLVPTPVPFLKIGLANISSLVALMLFSPGDLFLVLLVRIFVGSLLTGSLFGPSFVIGISGGIASAVAMLAAKTTAGNYFSVVGISLIGSMTHVVAQLLMVMFLFVRSEAVLFLLPFLLATGIAGGLIVGLISLRILPAVRKSL